MTTKKHEALRKRIPQSRYLSKENSNFANRNSVFYYSLFNKVKEYERRSREAKERNNIYNDYKYYNEEKYNNIYENYNIYNNYDKYDKRKR